MQYVVGLCEIVVDPEQVAEGVDQERRSQQGIGRVRIRLPGADARKDRNDYDWREEKGSAEPHCLAFHGVRRQADRKSERHDQADFHCQVCPARGWVSIDFQHSRQLVAHLPSVLASAVRPCDVNLAHKATMR